MRPYEDMGDDSLRNLLTCLTTAVVKLSQQVEYGQTADDVRRAFIEWDAAQDESLF